MDSVVQYQHDPRSLSECGRTSARRLPDCARRPAEACLPPLPAVVTGQRCNKSPRTFGVSMGHGSSVHNKAALRTGRSDVTCDYAVDSANMKKGQEGKKKKKPDHGGKG